MRGCLGTIIAILLLIILISNFNKFVKIGDALVDDVYSTIVDKDTIKGK